MRVWNVIKDIYIYLWTKSFNLRYDIRWLPNGAYDAKIKYKGKRKGERKRQRKKRRKSGKKKVGKMEEMTMHQKPSKPREWKTWFKNGTV